jgi:hypothetical protein
MGLPFNNSNSNTNTARIIAACIIVMAFTMLSVPPMVVIVWCGREQ